MKKRIAPINRKTSETQIRGNLTIDGKGQTKIKTPVGLLTHMLELFSFHGCFDLTLEVKGDTHIDIHHTNEDIGIALGQAFKKALGDKAGIKRFGWAFAPMEATLGQTVVDISGRGYFKLNMQPVFTSNNDIAHGSIPENIKSEDGYNFTYLDHFMESFANGLGATISVSIANASDDLHTTLETVFKSLGLALRQATEIDPRRAKKVPSTKGIID